MPGLVESATLFATQMKDAGVRMKVVRQDSAAFYDKTWLKAPLYTTYWGTNDSVLFFAGRTMTSKATQNETGWKDRRIDSLYRRAVGDPSEERRAEAVQRPAAPAVRAGRLRRLGHGRRRRRRPLDGARPAADRWLRADVHREERLRGLSMLRSASRTRRCARALIVARTLVTIAVVAAAVFLLTEALPGDATSGLVERGASPAAVAAARAELGLDQSTGARLWQRLEGLAHGDLGHTARGRPVGDVLARPLRRTLMLAGIALLAVILVAVPLGAAMAWRGGRVSDKLLGAASVALISVPEFVVFTLLALLLSSALGLLPAVVVTGSDGRIDAAALVLPALALALPAIAWTARLVRGAVADALAAAARRGRAAGRPRAAPGSCCATRCRRRCRRSPPRSRRAAPRSRAAASSSRPPSTTPASAAS